MNGHIGSSNVGYDGTHGGFGYGSRNADGSRILQLAVTAENEEELIKRLNEWKDNVDSKGMRVNVNKTKWRTSEGEADGCKMAMWGLQ